MSTKRKPVTVECQDGQRRTFASFRQAADFINCNPMAITWAISGVVQGYRIAHPTEDELNALDMSWHWRKKA